MISLRSQRVLGPDGRAGRRRPEPPPPECSSCCPSPLQRSRCAILPIELDLRLRREQREGVGGAPFLNRPVVAPHGVARSRRIRRNRWNSADRQTGDSCPDGRPHLTLFHKRLPNDADEIRGAADPHRAELAGVAPRGVRYLPVPSNCSRRPQNTKDTSSEVVTCRQECYRPRASRRRSWCRRITGGARRRAVSAVRHRDCGGTLGAVSPASARGRQREKRVVHATGRGSRLRDPSEHRGEDWVTQDARRRGSQQTD